MAWDEPTEVKGVREKYILKAYGGDKPQAHIPSACVELDDTSSQTGWAYVMWEQEGSETTV